VVDFLKWWQRIIPCLHCLKTQVAGDVTNFSVFLIPISLEERGLALMLAESILMSTLKFTKLRIAR
jgi:hypothetical protein